VARSDIVLGAGDEVFAVIRAAHEAALRRTLAGE
jgi:uncharacterized protein YqgV (UPF0045/DUF77 family)